MGIFASARTISSNIKTIEELRELKKVGEKIEELYLDGKLTPDEAITAEYSRELERRVVASRIEGQIFNI